MKCMIFLLELSFLDALEGLDSFLVTTGTYRDQFINRKGGMISRKGSHTKKREEEAGEKSLEKTNKYHLKIYFVALM